MIDNPEWVRCVAHQHGKTWCGKASSERSFSSIQQTLEPHRLLVCVFCSDKIRAAIKSVSFSPGKRHRPRAA